MTSGGPFRPKTFYDFYFPSPLNAQKTTHACQWKTEKPKLRCSREAVALPAYHSFARWPQVWWTFAAPIAGPRDGRAAAAGTSAIVWTLHQFRKSMVLRSPGRLAQPKGKLDPEGCWNSRWVVARVAGRWRPF